MKDGTESKKVSGNSQMRNPTGDQRLWMMSPAPACWGVSLPSRRWFPVCSFPACDWVRSLLGPGRATAAPLWLQQSTYKCKWINIWKDPQAHTPTQYSRHCCTHTHTNTHTKHKQINKKHTRNKYPLNPSIDQWEHLFCFIWMSHILEANLTRTPTHHLLLNCVCEKKGRAGEDKGRKEAKDSRGEQNRRGEERRREKRGEERRGEERRGEKRGEEMRGAVLYRVWWCDSL